MTYELKKTGRKRLSSSVFVTIALGLGVALSACENKTTENIEVQSAEASKSISPPEPLPHEMKRNAAESRTENTSAAAGKLVWVYIDNGAVQCEKPGLPLSDTKATLTEANVEVFQSQCAHITGAMVATMCGLKDLGIHVHEIRDTQLSKARSLGFEPAANISHHGDKNFEMIECR